MTLQKVIQLFEYGRPYSYIHKKKEMDFSLIKKYPYIQVAEYWFDDPDDPDQITWTEIEGMGYGWIWDVNWFRRHSKFLQRMAIRKLAYDRLSLILSTDRVLLHGRKKTGGYIYGFMLKEDCYVEVRLSDREIDF